MKCTAELIANILAKARSPKRILLIEDCDFDHALFVRQSRDWNVRIDWAKTAELGIETAIAGSYDVVVCDLSIGAGMCGVDVANRILDAKPNQVLCIYTGSLDNPRLKEALGGSVPVLTKASAKAHHVLSAMLNLPCPEWAGPRETQVTLA